MQAKPCWVVNLLNNKMHIMLVFSTQLQADIIHYYTDFTNIFIIQEISQFS